MESKHSTLDKGIVIGPVIGLYKMSEVSDWLSRSKPASKPAVLEPSGNMGKARGNPPQHPARKILVIAITAVVFYN